MFRGGGGLFQHPVGISEPSLRKWKPTDTVNIITVARPRTVSSASSSEHPPPRTVVKDSFRRPLRERPTGMRANEWRQARLWPPSLDFRPLAACDCPRSTNYHPPRERAGTQEACSAALPAHCFADAARTKSAYVCISYKGSVYTWVPTVTIRSGVYFKR